MKEKYGCIWILSFYRWDTWV